MASLEGSLFVYGSDGLVAFESPVPEDAEAQGYIVFLGGLGDGTQTLPGQIRLDLPSSILSNGERWG